MSTPSLIKQPGESRLYEFDFSPLLAAGEVLTGVTSVTVTPDGLTLSGSAAYSGATVQQRIAGGTTGTRYVVTVVVTTSLGNTLEVEGILQVRDL